MTDFTLTVLACLFSLSAGFLLGVRVMVWAYNRNMVAINDINQKVDALHKR